MFATEIVRSAWRLRRCASAEHQIGLWNVIPAQPHAESEPAAPVLFADTAALQNSIDRARTQTQNALRRLMADLKAQRAERLQAQHDRAENQRAKQKFRAQRPAAATPEPAETASQNKPS